MIRVQPMTPPHSTHRRAWPMVLGALWLAGPLFAQSEDPMTFASGDVMRGWRVFHEKKCVSCHAVWDQGGKVGPDLGKVRNGRLTAGQLAGVMWNHIPKMLGQMDQTGHPPTKLSRQEMADLFALMFFVRQLDELGDPVRGAEVLRNKGCSECHETGADGVSIGPDLAKWGAYVNPIIWAQMMWEHAPMMQEAMERADVTWPKLEGSDLVHIVAFVRSVGATGERSYLRPGSALRGRELFEQKQCKSCHQGPGPDLSVAELPRSAGALASHMWNHSPTMMRVMREEKVARQPISPQELADIIAYLLALGNVDRGGDRGRGEDIFAQKGCIQCHDSDEVSETGGPPIGLLSGDATPVNMAGAMWNHGETMLERMTEAGLSWPVFHDNEMVDLLAYLESVRPAGQRSDK